MDEKEYVIFFSERQPELEGLWDGSVWGKVESLEVAFFLPEGSGHRPRTRCKLLYSLSGLHGLFRVDDCYVRCLHTGFQAEVYRDSCVEFFVQPRQEAGYFNFEFNCGGAMLASYVTDPVRIAGRPRGYTPLSPEEGRMVLLYHDLPERVEPEVGNAVVWHIEFFVPFCLFERYVGPLGDVSGQTWRANFYKCGNDTSHPHWAAWAPIVERNFHAPASFGAIRFERKHRS